MRSPPRVITGAEPFYEAQAVEAGLVGAGLPAKGSEAPGEMPETFLSREPGAPWKIPSSSSLEGLAVL
jgi:hypothetical protein